MFHTSLSCSSVSEAPGMHKQLTTLFPIRTCSVKMNGCLGLTYARTVLSGSWRGRSEKLLTNMYDGPFSLVSISPLATRSIYFLMASCFGSIVPSSLSSDTTATLYCLILIIETPLAKRTLPETISWMAALVIYRFFFVSGASPVLFFFRPYRPLFLVLPRVSSLPHVACQLAGLAPCIS